MRLPGYAIQILLTLLFFLGAAVRFSATSELATPYFEGPSAMNYRHAMMATEGENLDRLTDKAAFPEGYKPARYRPAGVEFMTGYVFKGFQYFSELDGRRYIRRATVLVFCLCIFTFYLIARNLWNCQVAGLVAAFLVAFFPPLIDATNGREFSHSPFGVFLASIHVLLLLRHRLHHGKATAIISSLIVFLMLDTWELAPYYTALCALYFTLADGYSRSERTLLTTLHAAVLVIASFAIPQLQAVRMIAAWPTALAVACVAVSATGGRLGTPWRRAGAIVVATAVLTLLLTPVRAGASENIPVLKYVFYRLRYLVKPASPTLLPDTIRQLWTGDHASPSLHTLLTFFIPMVFLGTGAALMAALHRGRNTVFAIMIVGAAAVAWCIDRSAIVISCAAIFPILAVAGRGVTPQLAARGALVAICALLAIAGVVYPRGNVNPAYAIARAGGFENRDAARPLRVSTENTDRELLRFTLKRTSTRNAILGPPDITALLLTFAGRKSVALEGALSDAAGQRNVELTGLMYGDEVGLQRFCSEHGVAYVLYSIEYLLDASRYSPRYRAGVTTIDESAIFWQMHFSPHTLSGFTLVYENDHYRLFRVSDGTEPAFLTDHPPVYQSETWTSAGGDIDAFRRLNTELILTYSEAIKQREMNNYPTALNMFSWCLERAPRFTKARIGLAETLMHSGRLVEARDVMLSVVRTAPDNERALYTAAYLQAQLNETTQAAALLEIFSSLATNPELIERARLLKTFLDQGVPVVPNAESPADTTG